MHNHQLDAAGVKAEIDRLFNATAGAHDQTIAAHKDALVKHSLLIHNNKKRMSDLEKELDALLVKSKRLDMLCLLCW